MALEVVRAAAAQRDNALLWRDEVGPDDVALRARHQPPIRAVHGGGRSARAPVRAVRLLWRGRRVLPMRRLPGCGVLPRGVPGGALARGAQDQDLFGIHLRRREFSVSMRSASVYVCKNLYVNLLHNIYMYKFY